MRRRAVISNAQLVRFGGVLTGATFIASAALAGDLAREHMALLGTICGSGPHPHCGWCYGAASLLLAGLAPFWVAANPGLVLRKSGLLQIKAKNGQA